ncbi:hypothetical protein [uncultured Thiocystis sp.]|uniref:hypothetical protein n=1 Tax=uncultured Thiocystis sp. TaxID=1202134 RepID=UPI0025D5B4FF|nr:hypothetical protein [uncultured Thiocystis sp.]
MGAAADGVHVRVEPFYLVVDVVNLAGSGREHHDILARPHKRLQGATDAVVMLADGVQGL